MVRILLPGKPGNVLHNVLLLFYGSLLGLSEHEYLRSKCAGVIVWWLYWLIAIRQWQIFSFLVWIPVIFFFPFTFTYIALFINEISKNSEENFGVYEWKQVKKCIFPIFSCIFNTKCWLPYPVNCEKCNLDWPNFFSRFAISTDGRSNLASLSKFWRKLFNPHKGIVTP